MRIFHQDTRLRKNTELKSALARFAEKHGTEKVFRTDIRESPEYKERNASFLTRVSERISKVKNSYKKRDAVTGQTKNIE